MDVLRSQLKKAESDLVGNAAASTTARVQFLSTVRDRHSVELELLRTTVDEGTRLEDEIDAMRSEIRRYQESARDLENKFARDYLPVYSKHIVSTSLYLVECESKLASAQKKRKQREDRLCALRTKTNQQRCMVEEMREERTRISRGFAELDRREEEDDEETMALGMQIKDLLAKVRVCDRCVCVCVCVVLCSSNPCVLCHCSHYHPTGLFTLTIIFVTFLTPS